MRVLDVAVIPPIPDHEVLSYAPPATAPERLQEGMRVVVPLARRQVTGIVVAVREESSPNVALKEVLDVPDEAPILTPDLLELCRFAAGYYMASLGEVLATAVLAGLRAQSRRLVRLVSAASGDDHLSRLGRTEREVLRRIPAGRSVSTASLARLLGSRPIHEALRSLASRGIVELVEEPARAAARTRYETFYVAAAAGPDGDEAERLARRAPLQHRCLLALRAAGEDGLDLEALGGAAARTALRALIARGWVHARRREVYRSGAPERRVEAEHTLTGPQNEALAAIESAGAAGSFETFLLRGVTGSGKTEVYLRAARSALERGRGVMLLVPEIGLTEDLVARVLGRFGSSVALLHSALSPGERWDEWRRLARREARVLVGVRSAVFAPLPDLGLVIVDEEHDGAYKQEDGLRYNARDLAIVRARNASCPVVLGSATPSIESHWNAETGRYRRLELPERIELRPLPTVDLVDLRTERPEGDPPIFAPRLREALAENLAAGSQSLLFLNRRGFAHYLQCTVCGHVIGCPNCSVTLTFHLRQRALRCHHCDYRLPAPDLCPQCTSPKLRDIGFGTEQVEAALRKLFPTARVARMDRDTTARRGAHREILSAWRREQIDVLVGTQMVAKGHDIPGVTLVGVIAADPSLNLPDFRAAERTFQMLTQVSGRAGRGDRPGRVLIQTYRPDHYALRHALTHDFPGFAEREIRYRESLDYPPFSRLVNLRADGPDAGRVEAAARELAAEIRTANAALAASRQAKVLGPAPAPLERLRGRYRWQLLVKKSDPRGLRNLVRAAVDGVRRRLRSAVRISIDVDPYGML